MYRGGALTRRGPPGNWGVEGPIDLEDPGAVAIAFELAPVARWQAMASQAQHLPGGDVKQNSARRGQCIDGGYRRARDDLAAEGAQIRGQGIGQLLRPPAWERPADHMPEDAQHQPKRCRRHFVQWHDGMGREPRKETARPRVRKDPFR